MSLPEAVTQETRAMRPYRKFEGHTSDVLDVIHLPCGQRIMTSSRDSSLRVWDLESGKQIGNDWRDGESIVSIIALSPDGKKVASGSEDGAVRLWDADTGKVTAKWTGHTDYIISVCWSQDGGQVVSGSYGDETTRVWDVKSGKTVLAIETGFSKVGSVIYSPDMTMIATGGYNEEQLGEEPLEEKELLKIWDAKTGKLVANLKGHTYPVYCLAWTADGKMLISGSNDHSIRMWNTTTWQQIVVLTGHTSFVYGIAISPNGRILASTSDDSAARLWNLENGQPIGSPLQHDNPVNCVSFSTDGKFLATGCNDNNAYTWDISAVVKEAGLSDLLNPCAGATRRRGDWRRNPYPGHSNDTPHHPHFAGRDIRSPSSVHQYHISAHISSHQRALPGRISSPSRGNNDNAGGSPTQPRFLKWARNTFSTTQNRRHDEGIELPERRTEVVDVPLGQARPRYYSAREVQMDKEKAINAREAEKQKVREAKSMKNTKNALASGSLLSESNVNPQPCEGAQMQPTLGLHSSGLSTSSTPATAAAPAVTRWARFWLAACCISVQNADHHH